MPEDNKLNPSIRTVKYGKRELKELELLPLAIADQLQVMDLVEEVINDIVAKDAVARDEGRDGLLVSEFINVILTAVRDNLQKILALVTEKTEGQIKAIFKELTNDQFMGILNSVWEVNFEGSLKNGIDLFEKVKSLFRSERSSQELSSDTPSMDSPMFTENPGEKEDSHSDN